MSSQDADPNFSPVEAYQQKLVCNNCNNDDPEVIEDFAAGDLICGDCGLVLGDRVIDMRSEWRTFSNDNAPQKDNSRVGAGKTQSCQTKLLSQR